MMYTCTQLIDIRVGYGQSYAAGAQISCSRQTLDIAMADRRNSEPVPGFDRTRVAVTLIYM